MLMLKLVLLRMLMIMFPIWHSYICFLMLVLILMFETHAQANAHAHAHAPSLVLLLMLSHARTYSHVQNSCSSSCSCLRLHKLMLTWLLCTTFNSYLVIPKIVSSQNPCFFFCFFCFLQPLLPAQNRLKIGNKTNRQTPVYVLLQTPLTHQIEIKVNRSTLTFGVANLHTIRV